MKWAVLYVSQCNGINASTGVAHVFIFNCRDKPHLATKRNRWEAWVMVIVAILSSVVAVSTDVFNLFEPSQSTGAPTGLKGYW